MPIPVVVGSGERVGHSIKGSGLKSALNYGRIFSTLLTHVRSRGEMSVDRVSLAESNGEIGMVVRAAEDRTKNSSGQEFQGWAMMDVEVLGQRGCDVESAPIRNHPELVDNEYHANVLLPTGVVDKRAEIEQFVRELMKVVGWQPRPERDL